MAVLCPEIGAAGGGVWSAFDAIAAVRLQFASGGNKNVVCAGNEMFKDIERSCPRSPG